MFSEVLASQCHAGHLVSGMSVPEHPLHFGPRTSITTPLNSKALGFCLSCSLNLEICQQSRPWECGNPEGISKACGKGGKPDSGLSMLSILCHFHDLLWQLVAQSQSPRRPGLGTGTTCPNRLVEGTGEFIVHGEFSSTSEYRICWYECVVIARVFWEQAGSKWMESV